jgi:hypothetical protein
MGKEYQEIDGSIRRWLGRQRLFFVATAPGGDSGLVNCSPISSLDGLPGLRMSSAEQGDPA